MAQKIQPLCQNFHYFTGFIILTLILHQTHSLSIQPRIIDGKQSKIGQFPWQVLIKDIRNDNLRGGGSIISTDWVLTAAHCTFGLSAVFMKVGTNFVHSKHGIEMTSKDIHIHPEYNDENLNNDVSLIKLPKKLVISSTVRPIRLVSNADKNKDFVGNTAFISGYGFIDDGVPNTFDDLLYAEVKIISNEVCKESYEDKVLSSTMCSVGADGTIQSFCDGDSGGPLVLRDTDGEYIQIGIISFSAKLSCSKNYPAAFARITSFLDYIAETTKLSLN